jgi:hypothetical protein
MTKDEMVEPLIADESDCAPPEEQPKKQKRVSTWFATVKNLFRSQVESKKTVALHRLSSGNKLQKMYVVLY